MRSRIFWIALLILSTGIAAMPQSFGPEDTVKAFYKFSNSRSSIFNRRHIESRRQWYTPALYREFLAQLREDQIHLKTNPTDKPIFGDGLDFRPLDEPCESNGRSYRRYQTISRRVIEKNRAYIDVRFAYPKACTGIEPIYYRVGLSRIMESG